MKKLTTPWLWQVSTYLSIVGIILSVYLLYSQIFRPAFQPCYINSSVNCEAVISGAVSKFLGIPTPLYGLVGYIVILVAIILRNKKLFMGMSLFGVLFCLRLTIIEVFQIKVYCPICLTCQLVMLLLFLISLKFLYSKDQDKSTPPSTTT